MKWKSPAWLVFLCSPLMAQQPATPVVVDAAVTGPAGAPIEGLTAADFHILEDGRERPVTALQPHSAPAAPGIPQEQRAVLLIGPQTAESQRWIQQAAAKFIVENAGPARSAQIIFTDVCYTSTLTPFSNDARELQHVLDAWPDLLHCEHPADANASMRAAYYAQVAQSLARAPGHKVVVMFVATDGPLAAADNKPPETAPATRRGRGRGEQAAKPHQDPFDMEREFRKADASVYPVQTQAGMAMPGWVVDLATYSGGHPLGSEAGGLDQLTREQNGTYRLAFAPEVSAEGSCHEVKVTVSRQNAKVFGRNLYCNVVEEAKAAPVAMPPENDLDRLAASDQSGDVEASAAVPYFYEAGGVALVNMALDIPAPVLQAREANGKVHAEMDVLGVAYDSATGQVAARFTHKAKFDFDTRRQFDDFVKRPLHLEHQFEIVPGDYQFKVIFRSAKDSFGAVESPLAIPPLKAAQMGLSAIALSSDVQPITAEAAQEVADAEDVPLIFRGNRIVVSGSDHLARTGRAEAYFEVYDPAVLRGAKVELSMRMRLLDARGNQERWNSGDVDLSNLVKAGERAIPVAVRLPVEELQAGSYRAELTVKDSGGGHAVRVVEFRTE